MTDPEDTKRLAELVRNRLLESFSPGKADALRNAMHGANPDELRNLLADIKRGCDTTDLLPIEGWKPFSETLFELAELDPPIGIPLILALVTVTEDRLVDSWDDEKREFLGRKRVTRYQFQEGLAKKVFDWNRLTTMLAKQCIPPDIEDGDREMWKAAKRSVIRDCSESPERQAPPEKNDSKN